MSYKHTKESNMSDEIRSEEEELSASRAEQPTGDAETGAILGGVGGVVTGAMAGAIMGPGGAIIGAMVGGAVGAVASGLAIAGVDKIDNDEHFSGFPDDLTIDVPDEREPMIIERDMSRAPHLEDTSTGWETPIGVGLPEAIALTQPRGEDEPATGSTPRGG